ncbi:MAG: hypothetical protein KF900_10485 [Bacteroidetes bacterium]|nr:hypothetical protein [Bacteroidota bacterium]
MKKVSLLIFAFVLVSVSSCKKEKKEEKNKREDGTAIIAVSWNNTHCPLGGSNGSPYEQKYVVEIALGYNSTDINNEVYFAQSGSTQQSPLNYTKSDLAPGTYYYRAKKRTASPAYCGSSSTVIKDGVFTIKAGETTNVDVGF